MKTSKAYELTTRAIRTVLDYTTDPDELVGVSDESMEMWVKVSFDILQESISGYLTENSPCRGMVHSKDCSEPIFSGQVCYGEC